jgi:hypothetical protein
MQHERKNGTLNKLGMFLNCTVYNVHCTYNTEPLYGEHKIVKDLAEYIFTRVRYFLLLLYFSSTRTMKVLYIPPRYLS